VRFGDWSAREIDILNVFQLLTAKPVVYLVNLSKVSCGVTCDLLQGQRFFYTRPFLTKVLH